MAGGGTREPRRLRVPDLLDLAGELVMIPAGLLDVQNIEEEAFTVGFPSWLIVVWILIRKSMLLVSCPSDDPGGRRRRWGRGGGPGPGIGEKGHAARS